MRSRRRAIAGVLLGLVFTLPLVFMVFASLRPPGLPPPDGFELLPDRATLETYEFVFLFIPLWGQIANSMIVAIVAVPVSVLVASMAGYSIVTGSPRLRKALLVLTLIALSVPVAALWIPRFVIFKWIGLTDNLVSLMTPALMGTAPFSILIFTLAYSRVPKELFEAARLDGWSAFQIWRRVGAPMVRPATFAVTVLAFVAYWSNFTDALLYITDEALFTVPLGLRQLQTLEPQNFPILLAGAVIATLPAVVAFLAAQRALFSKTLDL